MRWLNRQHIDIATALSVALSAFVAVVAGRLAGRWTWSLFAAFVAVVVMVAGLEIVRGRAATDKSAVPAVDQGDAVDATRAVVAAGRRSQAAGRDIKNTKIGTGGIGGFVGVLVVATVLSGGTIVWGRYESGMGGLIDPAEVGTAERAYSASTFLVQAGSDLDPQDVTRGLRDVALSQGRLVFLNNAEHAPAPAGALLSPDACGSVDGWSSATIDAGAARSGVTLCIHTSDGRIGTVNVTDITRNSATGAILGANLVWTVWY